MCIFSTLFIRHFLWYACSNIKTLWFYVIFGDHFMYCHDLQSWTKLLEKVFPIMSTFLHNKTISKTTPLREGNPFPRFNVASQKCPGIRLSFEYTTTLLSGEGGEGRTGTATIFRKMLSKYTIFSTVLSKIVAPGISFLDPSLGGGSPLS